MYILQFVSWLFWPIIILAVVGYLIRYRHKRSLSLGNSYLNVALSKEEGLSQLFFLLAMGFLSVSLFAINHNLGDPFSGRSILLFGSVLGIFLGYKLKYLYTTAFSVIAFVVWWGTQTSYWIEKYDIRSVPILTGLILMSLLLYLVGHFFEQDKKWKRFSTVFVVFGIIFFTGILFFLSTQWGLEVFSEMLEGASILASWEIMLWLIVFVVALVILFIVDLNKKLILAPEGLSVVLFALFGLVILLLPNKSLFEPYASGNYLMSYNYNSDRLSPIGTFWAVVFNIGTFLEMLGIILVGYMRKEFWHINLGAVCLFLLILVKYFDWFFESLDKSGFFIGAGVLLFVVGWLMERTRRAVIKSIQQENQTNV